MASLDPRLSGKLDRVIGISRPTVADPEGDNIVYGVRRAGELVQKWQTYGHEVAREASIRLRLDLGLNAGILPGRRDIPRRHRSIFRDRSRKTNSDIPSLRFHPGSDPFDYCPEDCPRWTVRDLPLLPRFGIHVPGVNQRAAGAAFVVVELDRAFVWPSPGLRSIILKAGYSSARNGGLFVEEARQVWGRLEDNRITPDGRTTEWTIADTEIEVGDIILYGGQRLTVEATETIDRSQTKTVTATLAS